MTAADVNVPELVARALIESDALGCGCCAWADDRDLDADHPRAATLARDATAALRSPDVVAGIAGVVLAEQYPAHDPDDLSDDWQVRQAEVVAQAVVDWLTGGAR